jgi:hypothetical protein
MRHSSAVLLVIIQLAAFLGTLSLGKTGVVSGELAAGAALVVWFLVGLPLSFIAVDIVTRWQLRPEREQQPLTAIRSRSSSVA